MGRMEGIGDRYDKFLSSTAKLYCDPARPAGPMSGEPTIGCSVYLTAAGPEAMAEAMFRAAESWMEIDLTTAQAERDRHFASGDFREAARWAMRAGRAWTRLQLLKRLSKGTR